MPQKTFCFFICEIRHHGNFSNRLISNVKICSENYVIILGVHTCWLEQITNFLTELFEDKKGMKG